jgi:hypothetical protein
MKLILKSFSQDVDLENPEDIRYFLVFDAGGKEVKLPVQKDTTEALINLIYSNGESDGDVDSEDDGSDVGEVAFQAPNGGKVGSAPHREDPEDFSDAAVFSNDNGAGQEEEAPDSEEDVDSL